VLSKFKKTVLSFADKIATNIIPKIIAGVRRADAFTTPFFPFARTQKQIKHTKKDAQKCDIKIYSFISKLAPVIITENDTNKKRYVSITEIFAKNGLEILSIYSYGENIFSSFIVFKTKNTYIPNITDEKTIPKKLLMPNLTKNTDISFPVANPAPIIAPSTQNAVLNAFFIFITPFFYIICS
jgi:hypothetical protein